MGRTDYRKELAAAHGKSEAAWAGTSPVALPENFSGRAKAEADAKAAAEAKAAADAVKQARAKAASAVHEAQNAARSTAYQAAVDEVTAPWGGTHR